MTREIIQLNPIEKNNWFFRLYLIKADKKENIDNITLRKHLDKLIENIEVNYLSKEFEYFKIGFIICHFGKRGICISIWHWGSWIFTCEMFNQCWYCYDRDFEKLKILNIKEPRFCQHEVPILNQEFTFFHNVVSNECQNRLTLFRQYTPKL